MLNNKQITPSTNFVHHTSHTNGLGLTEASFGASYKYVTNNTSGQLN